MPWSSLILQPILRPLPTLAPPRNPAYLVIKLYSSLLPYHPEVSKNTKSIWPDFALPSYSSRFKLQAQPPQHFRIPQWKGNEKGRGGSQNKTNVPKTFFPESHVGCKHPLGWWAQPHSDKRRVQRCQASRLSLSLSLSLSLALSLRAVRRGEERQAILRACERKREGTN